MERPVYMCIFARRAMNAQEITDGLIARALQEGRQDAFEMIFKEWYTPLCRFACSLLDDPDESEEVVQNVFVLLWEKRAEVSIEISVKAYIYRAVRNGCLNVLKHRKVRMNHVREVKHYTPGQSLPASAGVLTSELELAIERALDSLPTQCRQVFELSRKEGLKYAEIARDLGISVKTVENHMGKALKILREELKPYLPLVLLWIGGNS
jgi:RNA polymerase sigma-70 factor (ECF subfamily)